MKREAMIARIRDRSERGDRRERKDPWDIVVIGGGATGAGIAVDAASRGYSVLLLEREDFGKGTSSRSTKLIHGGVRYLKQGNIPLVMEALKERGILLENAPHLVHDLPFIVPCYSSWEKPFYGIGLTIYDLLAGKHGFRKSQHGFGTSQHGFGTSRIFSAKQIIERLPAIRSDGLRGGVLYHDGQFDDARLLIALMMTAAEQGAVVLNYASAVDLTKDASGVVDGVVAVDAESGERFHVAARVVINATGIFADEVRRLAEPGAAGMIAPSQGIHLVFDKSLLPGDIALMAPHTRDGRLLFAIPWHDHTLVGTTDTPIDSPCYEPRPFEEEIQFVLETAGRYLSRPPRREDILSVYVGIRPLVKAPSFGAKKTSALSRDHTIHIDNSGLLTITGGKWTTYRRMAEDAVDHAIRLGKLRKMPCVTKTLPIHGYEKPGQHGPNERSKDSMSVYGSDAAHIRNLAKRDLELQSPLDPELPYIGAEVVWAAREEMARTLDDVLARRIRALPLNARAAMRMAPAAAKLLARELGRDPVWADAQVQSFRNLAAQYVL